LSEGGKHKKKTTGLPEPLTVGQWEEWGPNSKGTHPGINNRKMGGEVPGDCYDQANGGSSGRRRAGAISVTGDRAENKTDTTLTGASAVAGCFTATRKKRVGISMNSQRRGPPNGGYPLSTALALRKKKKKKPNPPHIPQSRKKHTEAQNHPTPKLPSKTEGLH